MKILKNIKSKTSLFSYWSIYKNIIPKVDLTNKLRIDIDDVLNIDFIYHIKIREYIFQ